MSYTLITQPKFGFVSISYRVDSQSPLRPNAVEASTGFHLFRERSKRPSREGNRSSSSSSIFFRSFCFASRLGCCGKREDVVDAYYVFDFCSVRKYREQKEKRFADPRFILRILMMVRFLFIILRGRTLGQSLILAMKYMYGSTQ